MYRICAACPYGARDFFGPVAEGGGSHGFLLDVLGVYASVAFCKFKLNGCARIQGVLPGFLGSDRAGCESRSALVLTCRLHAVAIHYHVALPQRIAALACMGLGPLGHLRIFDYHDDSDSNDDEML